MSTKIQHAYLLRYMSTKTLHQFIQKLKRNCQKEAVKNLYQMIASEFTDMVDSICMAKDEEIKELFFSDYEKFQRSLYQYSKEEVASLLDGRLPVQVPDDYLWRLKTGRFNTIFQIALNHIRFQCSIGSGFSTGINAFLNRLILIPYKDSLLCIVFGQECRKIMQEICDSKPSEYKDYRMEHYDYWDNTDCPDSISEKEWEQRERTWMEAMPSGFPSADGMEIVLTTIETVGFNHVFLYKDQDRILSAIPSKEDRMHELALNLTFTWLDKQNRSVDYREFKEQREMREGEYYKIYNSFLDTLEYLIPEITKEDFTKHIHEF